MVESPLHTSLAESAAAALGHPPPGQCALVPNLVLWQNASLAKWTSMGGLGDRTRGRTLCNCPVGSEVGMAKVLQNTQKG